VVLCVVALCTVISCISVSGLFGKKIFGLARGGPALVATPQTQMPVLGCILCLDRRLGPGGCTGLLCVEVDECYLVGRPRTDGYIHGDGGAAEPIAERNASASLDKVFRHSEISACVSTESCSYSSIHCQMFND
jgi:hypothetical protein